MASVAEAAAARQQLAATLAAGVDHISANQTITFTKYVKLVLPLDGYVFWVKAQLVSDSALFNATQYDAIGFGQPRLSHPPTQNTIVAQGSFHYGTKTEQNETESSSQNQCVFTSEVPVIDLDEVAPNVMYIGTWQGVRFSFSERRMFYQQADLYHYGGQAIFSSMFPQIIDDINGFDSTNVIVSNSLPIWLAMNQANPIYPITPNQQLQLYPSFLVPMNITPPYGSVHIEGTEAIQATPYYGPDSSRWQLVKENVEVTIYGQRNFNATDFLDFVLNTSVMTDDFGIIDWPVIVDDKLPQVEMMVIAMKKTISFQINYYQQRARNIARQLILTCVPTFNVGNLQG